MTRIPESDLKEIGLEAAQSILGPGKVEAVEVVSGHDSSDEPAHFFSFLIEEDRDPKQAIRVWSSLAQKIRDTLIERGDEAYPYIHILSRRDWEGRERARFF
jgi:hypothetical protein